MSKNAEILLKYTQDDFFILNQYEPNNINIHDRITAIYELIELGIAQKRNCEGTAYELK